MKLKNYSDYEIFPEEGKIWSYKRNRFLKGKKNKDNGYLRVTLTDDNGIVKQIYVHRLVAEVAIPNPDNLPEVNHKDENKTNNRVSNLEWCDRKYNLNFGTRNARVAEAKSKPVLGFKDGKIMKYFPSTAEAERCGFNQGNVASCCRGEKNTYKGCNWRFLNDYLADLLEEIQDEDMMEEEKEKVIA